MCRTPNWLNCLGLHRLGCIRWWTSTLALPSSSSWFVAPVRRRWLRLLTFFLSTSQAAGLIPLVHASAGPLLDIVVPYDSQPTGFHATTAETFADRLHDIMSMDDASQQAMRPRARANATERFSEAVFEKGWRKAWEQLKAVKRR